MATGTAIRKSLRAQLHKDHKRSAKAANLSYVSDCDEGVRRHKQGKGFFYTYKNRRVNDKTWLERIRKLAIPPSWSDVWICANEHGHIQATGKDLNGRKQYRYHTNWSSHRNETKFYRLIEFGKALPALRKRTRKDLKGKELTAEKVLATAIQLMELTYIRVGNNGYEKLYGSYGLTTLKDKHVKIGSEKVHFCFTGKKGIEHSITLKNKRLARVLKQCRDIPGKELFQYYNGNGERRSIDSGMVNNYIKEATGNDFSAKDFRTWAGTLHAVETFLSLPPAETAKDVAANIITVLDAVSVKLGNSRNICKKYYVHPGLISLYEQNKLTALLNTTSSERARSGGLNNTEKLMLRVLKKCD